MPASRINQSHAPHQEAVHRRIEALKPKMVSFLRQFVSIATVNPPGDRYLECVQFVEKKLKALGLKTRIHRVPKAVQEKLIPGSKDHPRYNLVARWDVGARKTLHFSGHYDVVPAGDGWKTNPFKPVLKGNKMIGRGTSDMKGCNTAVIFAVEALVACRQRPPWNLELSITADEETGGEAGLGHLVRSKIIAPDAAVLMEGGGGDSLGYGHRGTLWAHVTVIGKSGHGSNPESGINAVEKAADLMQAFKKYQRRLSKKKTRLLTNKIGRSPSLTIGGATSGGGSVNIIPGRFSFSLDRRLIPEERISKVKSEITAVIKTAKKRDADLNVEVAYQLLGNAAYTPPQRHIIKVAKAAHKAVTGRASTYYLCAGMTDMRYLTHDGKVPTVGYGISGGGAHSNLEYVNLDSIVDTAKIYAEIALRM